MTIAIYFYFTFI